MEGEPTSGSVVFHKGNPVLPLSMLVMRQSARPASFRNLGRAFSLGDDLICEFTRLAKYQNIEVIGKIVVVHHWILARIRRLQRHGASRLGSKELSDQRKSMRFLAIGKIRILLGATVAFRAEEFDIWLRRGETHGITAGFAGCGFPDRFVFETVVETSVRECSERESRERTAFFFFPLSVCLTQGIGSI